MRNNQPVTQREYQYPDDANILSVTDPKSYIKYVNQCFIDASGYKKEQLLGQPHNIIRHPDMPPAAFEEMWRRLKSGQSWLGMVKNRCKNGDHYWVSAYASPVFENGKIVEYQSVRSKPKREWVERAEEVYAQLNAGNKPRCLNKPFLGLRAKTQLGLSMALLIASMGVYALTDASALVTLIFFAVALGISSAAIQWLLTPVLKDAAQARAFIDDPMATYIYTGQRDELAQMALERIAKVADASAAVGRLGGSSEVLAEHASEMTQMAEENTRNIEEQQQETDQVAAATTQMAQSAQEVANNAQQAAEATERADQEAQAGRQRVHESSQSIERLADEMAKASDVIAALEQSSEDISGILDSIQSIAEQTNLLALNAAIEAARAGEHGRGFAVVAEEVRSLAKRTQDSTHQIHNMIQKLRSDVSSVVTVMDVSQKEAASSVSQANQAVTSLDKIAESVDVITELNNQIATAADEQRSVGEEVDRSISTISQGSARNTEKAIATGEHAKEVGGVSRDINRLVGIFWAKNRNS